MKTILGDKQVVKGFNCCAKAGAHELVSARRKPFISSTRQVVINRFSSHEAVTDTGEPMPAESKPDFSVQVSSLLNRAGCGNRA